MAHSDDEDSNISESEVEDFSADTLEKLKGGTYEFKCPDGSFRCPFCVKKKRKNYKLLDLAQHAKGISSSSSNFKQVAFHQALARFLAIDSARELPVSHDTVEVGKKESGDEVVVYVWPWMGIIVNIPTVFRNGVHVGDNGPKLKQKYSMFNPVKVHALWSHRGHTGYAVVDFRRDWSGFQDALNFSRHFEAERHGRKQWRDPRNRPKSIYGWIADEDDYKNVSVIGDHLRKCGDLRTISELEQEQSRKQLKLMASLSNQISKQEENYKHLKLEFQKTSEFLALVVEEKDRLDKIHNEEIKKLQQEQLEHFKKASENNEKLKMELERRKQELELRGQDLAKKEAQNENEKRRIEEERKKNDADSYSLQMAKVVQEKVDENVLRLAEEHKRARKQAHEEMIGREKKLNARHQLELEIEQLRGQLKVQLYMETVDASSGRKIAEMKDELKEKEETMEELEDLNRTLLIKERKSKDELLAARRRIIAGLKEMSTTKAATIGVKRMGVIDLKLIEAACNSRFAPDMAAIRAAKVCSLWQDVYFKDPEWYPFKQVIFDGKTDEEVLDEDDQRLKDLKAEWGGEIHKTITVALMELHKFNPGGQDCVEEIWNFRENRKASLREGIQYVLKRTFGN